MKFRTRRSRAPQVIIVSMIDVVLQLLIFFMLTTTFKAAADGLPVHLPELKSPPVSVREDLVIQLDGTGQILFGREEVTLNTLDEKFLREAESGTDRSVVIRADRRALHGQVVAIMDSAYRHGFRRLAVAAVSHAKRD